MCACEAPYTTAALWQKGFPSPTQRPLKHLPSLMETQKGLDSMSHGEETAGGKWAGRQSINPNSKPKTRKVLTTSSLQRPEEIKQSQSPIPFHLLCSHWRWNRLKRTCFLCASWLLGQLLLLYGLVVATSLKMIQQQYVMLTQTKPQLECPSIPTW